MATKKKKPPKKGGRPKPPSKDLIVDEKCNLRNVCAYLVQLSAYLQWLEADYRRLRIAVCNVERRAFEAGGVNTKPPRFCTPGSGSEPAEPMAAPVW